MDLLPTLVCTAAVSNTYFALSMNYYISIYTLPCSMQLKFRSLGRKSFDLCMKRCSLLKGKFCVAAAARRCCEESNQQAAGQDHQER